MIDRKNPFEILYKGTHPTARPGSELARGLLALSKVTPKTRRERVRDFLARRELSNLEVLGFSAALTTLYVLSIIYL